MTGPVSAYRRFIASTRGVAAIEFAMILPVMLILLLATFDAGNVIAVYMKVRSATFTMAAIANQYTHKHANPIHGHDGHNRRDLRGARAVFEFARRRRHFASVCKGPWPDHCHG